MHMLVVFYCVLMQPTRGVHWRISTHYGGENCREGFSEDFKVIIVCSYKFITKFLNEKILICRNHGRSHRKYFYRPLTILISRHRPLVMLKSSPPHKKISTPLHAPPPRLMFLFFVKRSLLSNTLKIYPLSTQSVSKAR
jgi:hypothetical protein